MGAVFFLGFVGFLFFVGVILFLSAFFLKKKHKTISTVLFCFAGIFALPMFGSICFLSYNSILAYKESQEDIKEEGILIYTLQTSGNEKRILRAIEKGDVFRNDSFGQNPLFFAGKFDLPKIIEILIEKGCDVNQRNNVDETPLHHAYRPIPCEVLIKAGADLNAENKFGFTPLHFLAERKTVASVLIENGADVNKKSLDGSTPLHMAAQSILFDKELAELYINAGADVNAVNEKGETPLLSCAKKIGTRYSGELEAMKYLIECGAKVQVKDNEGLAVKDYLLEKLEQAKKYGEENEIYKDNQDFIEYIEGLN